MDVPDVHRHVEYGQIPALLNRLHGLIVRKPQNLVGLSA